jgi:catecholate siderophore receptor
MSRQEKRANDRRLRKALRKISLAAGEGVGRAVAFSFSLASNAIAAEPKKEETFELPPVVVQDQSSPYIVPQSSLSKFPEPLKDTPQSITIVPQTLVEEQAGTTLRDALRNVPGITVAAGEGGGSQGDSFTLRGFNARNDMFIDGVRDSGSYFRDSFNFDSVEVIKGPLPLSLAEVPLGASSIR